MSNDVLGFIARLFVGDMTAIFGFPLVLVPVLGVVGLALPSSNGKTNVPVILAIGATLFAQLAFWGRRDSLFSDGCEVVGSFRTIQGWLIDCDASKLARHTDDRMNPSEFLVIADRPSDSPFVERVWRSHSERAGTMMSVASSHCEMVVTRLEGNLQLTIRGPETRATTCECPAGAEWIGIRFSLGSFMPQYPARQLMDRNDVNLRGVTCRSFWLEGSAWEYPDFENAESFVTRLVKLGLLARDPAIEAALHGEVQALSRRSTQRHFLHATGMTHTTFRKIERARYAVRLLRQGVSIADTVHEAKYYDQAHLTRSLRNLIGVTPARIGRQEKQLSFLYKTEPPR